MSVKTFIDFLVMVSLVMIVEKHMKHLSKIENGALSRRNLNDTRIIF